MSTGSERECIASWCSDDEWCTVTCTAHLIGKKWHPVVVHRLLDDGPLGFNALKEQMGDVSSTVLSDSLEDLEEKGLVDREVVSEKPFRVEYSLTGRGASLEPVIDAMDEWGARYLREDRSPERTGPTGSRKENKDRMDY